MMTWFRRKKVRAEMPEYSALRSVPTRGLPPDLAEKERSDSFGAQHEVIRQALREPPRRPLPDSPLFVELVSARGGGVLTLTLPENGAPSLPIFSSPIRAADYVRTLLTPGPPVHYLSSSPLELVNMLGDLRGAGIHQFTLDRCPRCDIFVASSSASMVTADQLIAYWSIWKATEFARLDLYVCYARAAALVDQLDVARDVALETIGHVSMEDPRAHLLLGEIAVALQDRRLVREAKAFLQFLGFESWEHKLDDAVRSGSPDFQSVG